MIHADPVRGTLTGNRGILHVSDRVMGQALWKQRMWIACTLDWQGRRRAVMCGRKWTELFFLDEAVALAAGHRPCGYCRRAAFDRWKMAWANAFGPWPGVAACDGRLHAARAIPGARRLRIHEIAARALPDGAMFRHDGRIFLRWAGKALPYAIDGYGPPGELPSKDVICLTNPVTLRLISAGYVPRLHPSARL